MSLEGTWLDLVTSKGPIGLPDAARSAQDHPLASRAMIKVHGNMAIKRSFDDIEVPEGGLRLACSVSSTPDNQSRIHSQ